MTSPTRSGTRVTRSRQASNEKVFAKAQAELSDVRSSSALERTKEALMQGMKLLAERQKLIKIADCSEYGWEVVAKYKADELADGSDNEKRLEKAAEQKALKRKRKCTEPSPKPAWSRVIPGQVPPVLATTPYSRPYHRCDVISGWGQHARLHVTRAHNTSV